MKCDVCKKWTVGVGPTTVRLQRGGTTVVFRDVPAQICHACGETSLDGRVALRLMAEADRASRRGQMVAVRRYKGG